MAGVLDSRVTALSTHVKHLSVTAGNFVCFLILPDAGIQCSLDTRLCCLPFVTPLSSKYRYTSEFVGGMLATVAVIDFCRLFILHLHRRHT